MATNLWPNADMEANVDDWSASSGGSKAHSTEQAQEQTYSGKFTPSTGPYWASYSDVKSIVSGSTQYTASIYIYPTATVAFQIRILDQDANLINSENVAPTANQWNRITNTFTTGADDTGIKFFIRKNGDASEAPWYLDAAMVETGGSASAWVNYSSGTDIAVGNVGDVSIAGYNPNTVVSGGLWEIGAYIYDAIGGTQVNVGNVGTTTIAGKVAAVGATLAIAVGNVGTVAISGLKASVTNAAASVGDGITRVAMKMINLFRR